MVEGKVALVIESSGVVQRRAVIEFIEGDDVVGIGIGQGQMSYQPASTVSISRVPCQNELQSTHMNPAPPVIIIFLTSGNGSNFVLPIRTGASFHTPKSSKNLSVSTTARSESAQFGQFEGVVWGRTSMISIGRVFCSHDGGKDRLYDGQPGS